MESQIKQNQKVIVLEGLDASGKHTQSINLHKYLESKGISSTIISFPNYESKTGKNIIQYLNGEMSNCDPYWISSIYMLNRYETLHQLDLSDFEYIIFDRYSTSNYLYQMPKLPKSEWSNYIKMQEMYEYDILNNPKPTSVVYLDLPAKVSRDLLNRRGRALDNHEKDLNIQIEARKAARYVGSRLGWNIIECWQSKPTESDDIHIGILPEDVIFDRIKSTLNL